MLAITAILHELRSGPCPSQSLLGSVVEHRSAESEDLRSDSDGDSEFFLCPTLVTRRKKISLFISLVGSKSKSKGVCIRCFIEKKPNFLL